MTRLSRFEQRILAAIIAVAVVPLAGSLFLGQAVLREAYQVGVNQRVQAELETGLEMFREHFVALRQSAEHVTDAVAGDWAVHRAIADADDKALEKRLQEFMERYDRVARVVIRDSSGKTRVVSERSDRLDPSRMRPLELQRTLSSLPGQPVVKVTVVTPAAPFEDYRRAGELVEVYSRLEAGTHYVSNVFLVVFIGFMLSVIAAALAVGIVMSRRVTRRVNMLAEATARVGAGDLSVSVPADAKDEIGDLTRAFNEMVRHIRESRDRIEYLQRIGAWQEFARRLAHEIKNPLTPIQLAVQEVHRGYRGDDERYQHRLNEALSIVEEEVATLRRLVGEFSEFARLPEVHLDPADLNDVVRDATRSATAGSENGLDHERPAVAITVRYEPHDGPLPVRVDAMMLKRCIDNLVRNSRQAIIDHERTRAMSSEPGSAGQSSDKAAVQGPAIGLVQIRTLREQEWAVVEVNDNGPGIAQQDRNRVFDPYFTTKTEGTGLGLAIVKKVVLEHGGEIECRPDDLGGVSFRIQIPLDKK